MEDARIATDAVFVESEAMERGVPEVKGYDFNEGLDYSRLFEAMKTTGFQASHFGRAVEIINQMQAWRLSDEDVALEEDDEYLDPNVRASVKCTVFLGFTSNMISCGVRESIRFLAQHRCVDAMVTTGGGIEEDFMKCLAPHYMGDFALKGKALRERGINRIGNLLVPNDNYVRFEEWMTPILDAMLEEQERDGTRWTPSRIIARLGKEINDERSVYYWAYKNNIPVYCPAITDGSIGDMIFFHSFKNPGLVVDLVEDIRGVNLLAMKAKQTGMIILGGGVVKHHICNANLMRNGADYAVFVNTAQEFDGSDAGARPDEAVSWGKIKVDAEAVKISGDASFLFPLLVSQTFAQPSKTKE